MAFVTKSPTGVRRARKREANRENKEMKAPKDVTVFGLSRGSLREIDQIWLLPGVLFVLLFLGFFLYPFSVSVLSADSVCLGTPRLP